MTGDELSREVRAVMFLLSNEAAFDGFDDRMLTDAHAELIAVIDRYVAEQVEQSAATSARSSRLRIF